MTRGDFARWMYRGRHPNRLAAFLNGLWAAVGALGFTRNYLETLEVTGRRTGRMISLPVVVTKIDGQRYLVSMLGDRADWVQNVRAAAGRATLRSGGREAIHLIEIPVEDRALVLKCYLGRAPGARAHVPISKDAALEEFVRIAPAFPVFRVAEAKAGR